jgi:hypothetical protein
MSGPLTLPEGARGRWKIERFTVSEDESFVASLRAVFSYSAGGRGALPPGTYTKLTRGGVIVMSDTPDEIADHQPAIRAARGHVLINGLGLGYVLGAVLGKPDVERVTVVEIDEDVIALVGPPVSVMAWGFSMEPNAPSICRPQSRRS